MSIATEIQRLQSAKADIKSAIEQKGVTVGDGTIDTYAKFIDQITSGGGGSGLNYKSGTVEFTDGKSYVIYHNLGVVPKTLYVWTEPSAERQNACLGIIYQNVLPQSSVAVYEDRTGYTAPKVIADYPDCVKEITDTYVRLTHRSATYPILTGTTYNWLVIE